MAPLSSEADYRPGTLAGSKIEKDRVTLSTCCNTEGSERAALFVVVRAARPNYFGGRGGAVLCFDYAAKGRACMSRELFFVWLQCFNNWTATTFEREAVLLMDNA